MLIKYWCTAVALKGNEWNGMVMGQKGRGKKPRLVNRKMYAAFGKHKLLFLFLSNSLFPLFALSLSKKAPGNVENVHKKRQPSISFPERYKRNIKFKK